MSFLAMAIESTIKAEVTVFSPLLSPTRHPLGDQITTIGRSADCTIPVKDRYLSRRHAELLPTDEGWVLKDCGSANGTYLNGARVEKDLLLKSGDRIRLGDTEIVYQMDQSTDRVLAVADSKISATISIPVREIVDRAPAETSDKGLDRLRILNALAMELIEERPYDQLFGFIVDRVLEHLKASRAAIGLIDKDKNFVSVEVRRKDSSDTQELAISRTLLSELVEEKKALAFMDVSVDEKLSRAKSIIMQGIHSVLCAPLTIGENVVGVLYVDFLFSQRQISENDVKLVAQIARFAAVKLENARLRDEAFQKRLMDEELKTAYVVQRRLLPQGPPVMEGYTFAGVNRPCKTVSGDYFDFVIRPDGMIYFVIADVSGKGVTAALPMAGLQTAFKIFTKTDPTPDKLVAQLNVILKENLPASKFITLFAGRLEAATGRIEYANAGHNPPHWIGKSGIKELSQTDLLLGMFDHATYRPQELQLEPGDSLLLFTDGVTEAENAEEEEFGSAALARTLTPMHGAAAPRIAEAVQESVLEHVGDDAQLGDDLTLVVVSRNLEA